MGKLFETSDEFVDLIEEQFSKTNLDTMGINIKVMSTTSAKDMMKVTKTSAVMDYITKEDTSVLVTLYEQAFDRLPKDVQEMLVEMALSNVSYDTEKDKLNIETNPFKQVFAMRRKYGEVILDNIELAHLTIQQIEDEERERKEAEKEMKKAKKAKLD